MSVRQCDICQHWQRRGGAVFAPRIECVALEEEQLSPRVTLIVTRMARLLAARGQCPAFSPYPNHPDAYRAEDLPTP